EMLAGRAFTFLVIVIAANAGGIGSFAAIWLVLVPLEGALSASRRAVAVAACLAVAATVLLLLAGSADVLPPSQTAGRDQSLLAGPGVFSPPPYASAVAPRASSPARPRPPLLSVGGTRHRPLGRHLNARIPPPRPHPPV